MTAITREFRLYTNAGLSIPPVIHVSQYDQGETWNFKLYQPNGQQFIPTDAAIVGVKADGNLIANAGTVSNGVVVITETEQMTAAPGKAVFEILFDGDTHGTANFVVLVEASPTNDGVASESDLSLFQEAIDSVNPTTIAQAVSDWMSEHLTPTTPAVDDTLTVQGAAADAKKTGDEIADLKSKIAQGGSFNAEVKAALDQFTASVLQLAEKVAYIDENGQDYYDDIDAAADALHSAMNPPVNLVSISAVYTQSGVVYTTDSLYSLRADLVVTAHYDDYTTGTVTTYVLSGSLTEGTSTLTVTYGGKTTTFNVVVSSLLPSGYEAISYLSNETNNGAYINTAYPASDMNAFDYEFGVTCKATNTTEGVVYGGRNGSSAGNTTKGILLFLNQTYGFTPHYGNLTEAGKVIHDTYHVPAVMTDKNTLVLKQGKVYLNGELAADSGALYVEVSGSHKFVLFRRLQASQRDLPFTGRIYNFYIKDGNGDFVLNYIPCKRTSDNVYGMYDSVSNAFISSSTSTPFTGGNV